MPTRGLGDALAAVFALLLFPAFDLVPSSGPDPSWLAGLTMAASTRMRWGHDIVYTYGPLGFLTHPTLWGTPSLLAIALSVLYVVTATMILSRHLNRGLQGLLSGRLPVVALQVLGGLIAALVVRVGWHDESTIATPLVYGLFTSSLVSCLRPRARPRWFYPALGGAVAVLALMKFDALGFGVVSTLAFCTSASATGAGPRRIWSDVLVRLGLCVGGAVSTVVIVWLVLRQRLGDLVPWIQRSLDVASGFNEGLNWRSPNPPVSIAIAWILGGLVVAAGVVAGVRAYQSAKRSVLFAGTLFGGLWLAAKSGFVRYDGHAYRYVAFCLLVVLAITAAVGSHPEESELANVESPPSGSQPRSYAALDLAAVAVVVAVLVTVVAAGSPARSWSDAIRPGPSNVVNAVRPLWSSQRRAEITAEGRRRIDVWAQMTPADKALLQGKRVHAEGEDIAAVWFLKPLVRWAPLPMIQAYNAYTPLLDQSNAERYADPAAGPDAVLYHAAPGDGHHPRFQSPGTIVSMLCNFTPQPTNGPVIQILLRRPNGCAASSEVAHTTKGRMGEPLRWSAEPGDDTAIVVGRFTLHRSTVDRVRSVLAPRPPRWTFSLGAADGNAVYAFDPGTAGEPHLLSVPACLRSTMPSFDTRTYGDITIGRDDGARFDVELTVTRIAFSCPTDAPKS